MKLRTGHVGLVTFAMVFAVGCGGDDKGGSKSGQSDASAEGGSSLPGCDITVYPSADDHKGIQDGLETIKSGKTLCLAKGTYKLNRSLSLTGAMNVTFKGAGDTRDDVLLDFTSQGAVDGGVESAQGMLVTTDGFTIENLSVKNTGGNGIKVQAKNSTFRNIKVGWDETKTSNGAYAIYPTGCDTTLLEDCEAYGAADAGVYTGTCKNVIARKNHVHDNVLGIEIENTIGAEAYENDVHDNTCGFLLDLLPGLQQKVAHHYLVHDNHVHDNNHENFAKANVTIAGLMPQGTGMMVLASSDVEIKNNTIERNGVGVTIISYDTVDVAADLLGGKREAVDPETNRWPERIYVHDNTYTDNGTAPVGLYAIAASAIEGGTTIPYDVFWDGVLTHTTDGGANLTNDADAKICLGTTEQGTFVNFHGLGSIGDSSAWTTDVTAHKCTLDPIAPLAK